jgi:hypothetical protein
METKDKKHHYRNVFKSDHLGSADLEDLIENGTPLIFTITHAKQEIGVKVAGKKMDANIIYFKEPIKPMVVNATNGKILKKFTGSSFVEDWNNVLVELYIDENVKAVTGGTTQGVRIMQIQPQLKKVKADFTEANFELAKKAGATKEKIESIYNLTDAIWLQYQAYVTA